MITPFIMLAIFAYDLNFIKFNFERDDFVLFEEIDHSFKSVMFFELDLTLLSIDEQM